MAAYQCSACGARGERETWVVLDASDRPDLFAALRRGELRLLPCPRCRKPVATTTSLLVDSRRRSPLLFAEDPTAGEERTKVQLFHSLAMHREPRGAGEWQAPPVLPISHELLPFAATRDVEDDIAAKKAGEWRAESVILQKYGAWLDDMIQMRRGAHLKSAIDAIDDVRDPASFASIVRAHPLLLSDDAAEMLSVMHEALDEEGGSPHQDLHLSQVRHLLRLCRRDGVDTVLKALLKG